MSVPGLVIGAPRSGSGKTTVTLGILRSLARSGVIVAPAKCGPDYIDTAFHRRAAGRKSVNLDSWAMASEQLVALAQSNAVGAELIIAEALMGFFDGVPAEEGRTGSSADVAAANGWPLVLVLDVSGQAQTAAAVACGFATFDPRIKLAGVILNKVGSERHRRLATQAIEGRGIAVLGAVPRSDAIALPQRHLGLVQAQETDGLDAILDGIADHVEAHVDIRRLRSLAPCRRREEASMARRRGDPNVDTTSGFLPRFAPRNDVPSPKPPAQRIAIARDAAFSFLYPHLLAMWRHAGAELAFFSPLSDEAPPSHCEICWLPGGYPELHAGVLAGNTRFLDGLRRFAKTGAIHGECGGYMVLGEGLVDAQGVRHTMAGLLGLETSFAQRKLHLGYREARLRAAHPLGDAGALLRGHEFHYATILSEQGEPFADVCDAYGGAPAPAGLRQGRVSGSFFHVIAST